jgi:hypothetical protein
MRRLDQIPGIVLGLSLVITASFLCAQESKPAGEKSEAQSAATEKTHEYSGMYTFLKEGEFVQLTVEDEGHVTGFISRFGDGDSDKGAFLNQFFKTGKLSANNLTFTTETVHGVSFDFKGTVERGEGKAPGDEAYYVLRGTLTENSSDINKKVTSRTRDVLFKLFPQDATPAPEARK